MPQFRKIEGIFVDSDIQAHFASIPTSDGKFSYWGYTPDQMTFEEACERLSIEIASRGLSMVEWPQKKEKENAR
jgi:hypothetical protein